MSRLLRAASAVLILACGGCAYTGQMFVRGTPIAAQAADFDAAVADSDRNMIVSNILRARDRESMSFGRLSTVSGSMQREVSGGLAANLGEGAGNDTLGPSFQLSDSSTPTFQMTVPNTQKFGRALHSEITLDTYSLYLAQDWQPGLIHTLFLANMSLSCPLIVQLKNARRLEGADFAEAERASTHCASSPANTLIRFNNDPTDWEAYEQFHTWLRILLSAPDQELTICPKEIDPTPAGPPIRAGHAVDVQGLVAASKEANLRWAQVNDGWQMMEDHSGLRFGLGCSENAPTMNVQSVENANALTNSAASFQVRSVEGVIYYLGQVVRENHLTGGAQSVEAPRLDSRLDGYVWRTGLAARDREDPVFRIHGGNAYPGIEVRHHGELYTAYYTPRGCAPDLPCENPLAEGQEALAQDRTQQVVELLLQLLGMLQEREDLPVSTVVTINR
jgi:hypothetical protein